MKQLIGVARELQSLSTYHIVLIIITTVFNTLEIGKSIIENEFDKHMECLLNMVQQKLNVLVTTHNLGLMCMKVKKIVNFAAFSGAAMAGGREAGGDAGGGGYKRVLNYLRDVNLVI